MRPFVRVLLPAILLAAIRQAAIAQATLSLPGWLAPFPDATPEVRTNSVLLRSTYTTAAAPADVVEHYRKLFQTAGLAFHPNSDGIGVAIRGATDECDLLIQVRPRTPGTFVDVNCAAKSQPPPPSPGKTVTVISSGAANRRDPEAYARRVAELGIHPTYHDAPAPPLVWPEWLVHIQGAAIRPQQGVDQSRKAYLKVRYVSSRPMTTIYNFYEDLLNSHEYRVHTSRLSTGQTIGGILQNAHGYVEGTNYPDGAPGARTVIHVGFSRVHLNDPITVEMRITAYEFVAPKRSF